MTKDTRDLAVDAAMIIADAGGRIVGKTRLQKAAYFLEEMGIGSGFEFYYKHYGPFSDDLSSALKFSEFFDFTEEEAKKSAWGGEYVIFNLKDQSITSDSDDRRAVLEVANHSDPVALELAATAIFLRNQGAHNVWNEVRRLKPDKASPDYVQKAKAVLGQLRALNVPHPLPDV